MVGATKSSPAKLTMKSTRAMREEVALITVRVTPAVAEMDHAVGGARHQEDVEEAMKSSLLSLFIKE